MAQELFQHNNVGRGYIHGVVNWRFVSTAARNDVTNNFTFRDLDKMCLDLQDGRYYLLKSINFDFTPVWEQCSFPGGVGEANTISNVGTGQSIFTAKTGIDFPFRTFKGTASRLSVSVDGGGAIVLNVDPLLQVPFARITATPTTLAGYGILDAAALVHTHGFLSLTETPDSYAGAALKFVKVNAGATGLEFVTEVAAATNFLELTDSPDSYAGNANKLVKVNGAANGLEFVAEPVSISTFIDLTDTPASYTGAEGKTLKVNAGASNVEFVDSAFEGVGAADITSSGTYTTSGSNIAYEINIWVVNKLAYYEVGLSGQALVADADIAIASLGITLPVIVGNVIKPPSLSATPAASIKFKLDGTARLMIVFGNDFTDGSDKTWVTGQFRIS